MTLKCTFLSPKRPLCLLWFCFCHSIEKRSNKSYQSLSQLRQNALKICFIVIFLVFGFATNKAVLHFNLM